MGTTVDTGATGKYSWEVDEVELDDGMGPVLNYYEWTVYFGRMHNREILVEGFAEHREDARHLADLCATQCRERKVRSHRQKADGKAIELEGDRYGPI